MNLDQEVLINLVMGGFFLIAGYFITAIAKLAWGKVQDNVTAIAKYETFISKIETRVALLERQDSEFKEQNRETVNRIHNRIDDQSGHVANIQDDIHDLRLDMVEIKHCD